MKRIPLALRITLNSAVMISVVYLVMQIITYFRDNIIFGISGTAGLFQTVWSFMSRNVVGPLLIFSVVIYLSARRFELAQRRLEAGERMVPAETEKIRRGLIGFGGLVLAVNLVGFTMGYILSQVTAGKASELLSADGLIILVSNLAAAASYARAQTSLNNLAFAPLRELLGIREIGERKREIRSTLRQILLTGMLAVYLLTFMQFNIRDTTVALAFENRVLEQIRSGEVSAADAEAVYRAALSDELKRFSSRVGFDPASVPLPWDRADTPESRQRAVFFMYSIFIFLVAMGIQASSSLDLRAQIQAVHKRLQEVLQGDGDLKKRLNLRNMDDIGELTELVNRLLAQFDSIVERISAAAAETGESAAAIATVLADSEKTVERSGASFAALQLDLEAQAKEAESLKTVLVSFATATRGVGEAAESQRRYVTDSSSAMEEMASSIESVERMTDSAGGLTVRLADRGVDGGKAVDDTAAAIAEIREASESVLEVLGSLNRIAASTNLLAMNASIEAAHAGDRGAGFAVVAEEVRNLAAEAGAQNRRIRDLVGAMRERVARGVSAAEASGTVLKDLVGGLKQAAAISTEISAAMKEQAAGTRSAADSLQMIVKASADIGGRVTEQDERSGEMARALGETIERLSALVAESRRQAESVTALRESFAAVRAQVDRNTSAADGLEAEIRRFRA